MVELAELLEDLAGSPDGIEFNEVRRRVRQRRRQRTGLRIVAAAAVIAATIGVWSIFARDTGSRLVVERPPSAGSVESAPSSAIVSAPAVVTAQDLAGRGFDSVAVTENGVPRPFIADTRLTMVFRESALVRAGCNRELDGYAIVNNMLSLGRSSLSYWQQCPPDLGAQEDFYFKLLHNPVHLTLDGNRLTLTQGAVVIEMLDHTDPALPNWPLVGTNWSGETVHADGSDLTVEPTAINAAAPPSLYVDAGGAATVRTGCSTGSGRAVIAGVQMTLRDLELGPQTTVAPATQPCPASLAFMDPIVRSILREPLTVKINGTKLVLQTADGRSVTFAGA